MWFWDWPALVCPRVQINATSIYFFFFFFEAHLSGFIWSASVSDKNPDSKPSLIFMQPSAIFLSVSHASMHPHAQKLYMWPVVYLLVKKRGKINRGKKTSENGELKRSHRPSKTSDAWFSRPPLAGLRKRCEVWRNNKERSHWLKTRRRRRRRGRPSFQRGDHVTAVRDFAGVLAPKQRGADASLQNLLCMHHRSHSNTAIFSKHELRMSEGWSEQTALHMKALDLIHLDPLYIRAEAFSDFLYGVLLWFILPKLYYITDMETQYSMSCTIPECLIKMVRIAAQYVKSDWDGRENQKLKNT